MNKKSVKLGVENLEDRIVMNAAMTAELRDGLLQIKGTSGDDTIRLTSDAGIVRVVGLEQTFDARKIGRIEIDAGAGNDLVDLSCMSEVPSFVGINGSKGTPIVINGGAGDDVLIGSFGNDRLIGGAGHDELYGLDGDDVLVGDAGTEVGLKNRASDFQVEWSAATKVAAEELARHKELFQMKELVKSGLTAKPTIGGVTERLDDIIDSVAAAIADSRSKLLEKSEATNKGGNDLLVGGKGDDELWGEDGHDRLFGDGFAFGVPTGILPMIWIESGGNDKLVGGKGQDWLDGGAGEDKLWGDAGVQTTPNRDTLTEAQARELAVELTRDLFRELVEGPLGPRSTSSEIEKAAQRLVAEMWEAIDQYAVAGGADALFGGAGNDVIFGEQGNDRIDGADGNDRLYGGSGHDRINGDTGDDVIYGEAGEDWISGGAGDDTIRGGSAGDVIVGGAGADVIYGDSGQDDIHGEEGNDLIYGGDGDDFIRGGNGDDRLHGGEGDDFIRGDDGNDAIYGNKGADVLDGGDGIDYLAGGIDFAVDKIYNRTNDFAEYEKDVDKYDHKLSSSDQEMAGLIKYIEEAGFGKIEDVIKDLSSRPGASDIAKLIGEIPGAPDVISDFGDFLGVMGGLAKLEKDPLGAAIKLLKPVLSIVSDIALDLGLKALGDGLASAVKFLGGPKVLIVKIIIEVLRIVLKDKPEGNTLDGRRHDVAKEGNDRFARMDHLVDPAEFTGFAITLSTAAKK